MRFTTFSCGGLGLALAGGFCVSQKSHSFSGLPFLNSVRVCLRFLQHWHLLDMMAAGC